MARSLLFACLTPVVLLFAGCLEYEEDLYLEKDGSGRVELRLGLVDLNETLRQMSGGDTAAPAGMSPGTARASEEDFRLMAEGIDGVEYISGRSYMEEGKRHVEAVLEFDSLESLAGLSDSGMGEQPDFFGRITWREQDGEYVFERRIHTSGGAETGEAGALGKAMMAGVFQGHNLRFTTHFPGDIVATNEAGQIDPNDPKTATWTVPLSRLMSEPVTLQARVATGGSGLTWALLLAVFAVVVIAAIATLIIVMAKRG